MNSLRNNKKPKMTSEIHTLMPKNTNLLNDGLVYNIYSPNSFNVHEFSNFHEQEFNHLNNFGSDPKIFTDPNMNLNTELINTIPPPSFNVTFTNDSSKFFKQKDSHNFHFTSPKGYESDESTNSFSSRGTPDDILKFKHLKNEDGNAKEFCRKYHNNILQTNLYHRSSTFNRNRFNFGHGLKFSRSKNSDLIARRAHGLMERFKSRTHIMKIDLNPKELLNGGPLDQLNQAIWDVFCSKIQKETTYINKLNLWQSIFLCIRKCLSNYGLFLVGSTMSGFGLEGSDIDMCLLTKASSNDPRLDSLQHLDHLKELLIKFGIATEAELIMAKVPILKFRNKETGFEVDLNCNNSVGIRNTHLLYCYSRLDWRVRPLVVIVKLWAQANNINDAKNMTISSYSWALMVIHYLQAGVTPAVLPCLHSLIPNKFNSDMINQNMDIQEDIEELKDFRSENKSCLGDLFIGFLHYYSNFNYSQYAISVRTGHRLPIDECRFLKMPKNDPNQWKCLCIEEPFDFSNTARSVFDPDIFKVIRNIIFCSYRELVRSKTLNFILPVNFNRHR